MPDTWPILNHLNQVHTPKTNSFKAESMIFSLLWLGLSGCVFLSDFQARILSRSPISPPKLPTCIVYLLMIGGEQYRSWIPSSYKLVHPPAIFILGGNTLPSFRVPQLRVTWQGSFHSHTKREITLYVYVYICNVYF